MTDAEKLVWEKLRNKKILGLTFRRQHPVNQFIADFYCHKARLVIEIDGSIHEIDAYKEKDMGRDDEFSKFGLTTIRFTNREVFEELETVISRIETICKSRIKDLSL